MLKSQHVIKCEIPLLRWATLKDWHATPSLKAIKSCYIKLMTRSGNDKGKNRHSSTCQTPDEVAKIQEMLNQSQ